MKKLLFDESMVISSEDANALHKMYEILKQVVDNHPSVGKIRMEVPRIFAENWIRSYEKLRYFMDVNKMVRPN